MIDALSEGPPGETTTQTVFGPKHTETTTQTAIDPKHMCLGPNTVSSAHTALLQATQYCSVREDFKRPTARSTSCWPRRRLVTTWQEVTGGHSGQQRDKQAFTSFKSGCCS